jgi:Xaa-Pro aminopeptidase
MTVSTTPELPFTREELDARLDNLRAGLASAGLAGGVYFSPEDIFYLSGYNTPGYYYGFQALVVPTDGDAFMVCRQVEESNVRARSAVTERRVFTDTQDPAALTVRALAEAGMLGGPVELDPDSFGVLPRHYLAIAEALGADMVRAPARVLHGLRRVKRDVEVDCVRRAAAALTAGMDASVAAVRAGASEDDVAAACYSALILAGSEYPGMPPMIASGHRAGLGHATWEGHRVIEPGDVVLLEIPGCVNRYHAAQARNVVVGKPSDEYRRRMDAVLEARASALDAMRPGATCAEVDAALRRPLAAAGLADHHLHRAGYGLGIAYPPHWDEGAILSLRADQHDPLEPNMIFHLLPAIYFFDETLIACTETVLVTPDGCEVLTPYQTGFIEV